MTPDQLRQLADDMEQRPDDRCWQFCELSTWYEAKPAQALSEAAGRGLAIRRKPQTITRTITHPLPVREPLEYEQGYYLSRYDCVSLETWDSGSPDMARLDAGCIFLTREDAEAHFQAHYRGWRDE